MPCITVRVRDEWLTVPCKDLTCTVHWLGLEALRRYTKNKPDNGDPVNEVCFTMRKCQGKGVLDPDDTLEEVLEDNDFVELNGNTLTTGDVVNLGKGMYKIKLTKEAENNVKQSWEVVENVVKESKGVGKPLNPERARMLLALRINALAKGYSGISPDTLHQIIEAYNEKGTVGASGDLAPLSHLALGLMGEGMMWSPKCGWADAKHVNIKVFGLALINGTQLITSLGSEAVERAKAIARQADIIAALTLEVLKGSANAFDKESHRNCNKVQDAYTLRCCPQALDYLAIGVHELASISERRIERLCNPSLSELPAFLVSEGGLNCGFMVAHCTAAALVSENKVLCHPSSVDSLSTSAATEDHVSMGGWAARKALKVVKHVEQELLAACQALEFLRPLKTTEPLERVYDLVRSVVRIQESRVLWASGALAFIPASPVAVWCRSQVVVAEDITTEELEKKPETSRD
ncbi:HUTH lyase, partial [Polypterus senegalus]